MSFCPKHKTAKKRLFMYSSEYCEECDKEKKPNYANLLEWDRRLQKVWTFYYACVAPSTIDIWAKDPKIKLTVLLYKSSKIAKGRSPRTEVLVSIRTMRSIREDEWDCDGSMVCPTWGDYKSIPYTVSIMKGDLFGYFYGMGWNPRACEIK